MFWVRLGAPDGWTQQTTDARRWRSRRFHSEHGSYLMLAEAGQEANSQSTRSLRAL